MSAALLSAALLSGCASVPMADATADAQAKQFVAPKDAANLYIYRNETFGTAGKNYYVWQEVKMGLLMARSKLSQVSEEEGKQGVMESKLVK